MKLLILRPISYLGHAFSPILEGQYPEFYYGRMAGFTLHLNQNYTILHGSTLARLQHSMEGESPYFNGHIMVPAPVLTHNNYQGESVMSVRKYKRVELYLGRLDFHLVKFDFGSTWQEERLNTIKEFPKLEQNKQEFGDNCYMVAYNSYIKTKNESLEAEEESEELANKPMFRDIIGSVYKLGEIRLEKPTSGNCLNGSCILFVDYKSRPASMCNHELDLGAPVFCGPNKKVTYLGQPFLDNHIGCNEKKFHVVHVPYMIDEIKKHVKLD